MHRTSSLATKFPWFVAGQETVDSHNETSRKAGVGDIAKFSILTDTRVRKRNDVKYYMHAAQVAHSFSCTS